MPQHLLMPKLGLTMKEGVLLDWKVAPGEAFSRGQLLFVVETDKAATDIEAEADGVFVERLVEEGETVPVGTAVGRLSGDAGTAKATQAKATPAEAATDLANQTPAAARMKSASGTMKSIGSKAGGERIVATPLARRLARKRGVELAGLTGSGPRGRIKAADVEGAASAHAASLAFSGREAIRRKPTQRQAAMARHLAAVKQGVPHFYLSIEIEVSALAALRERLNAGSELPKLTLTHFILAATARALADQPNLNRIWDDGEIVEFSTTDVSMAVETEGGLLVPVVRDAGLKSLDQVAAAARTMVDKARAGRLSVTEMDGAAIAISNAGMHDVTWITSIINPGQSAILGIGSVRDVFRPDGNGAPALRREMGVVFSGDHRVHTGVEGLAFLNRVKHYLENPMRLLRHG